MSKLEAFLLGILGACGALVLQFVFFLLFSVLLDPLGKLSFADFFSLPLFIFATALIEELFKYLLLAKKISHLSSPATILPSAILLGVGFFSFEFILISSNQPSINLQANFGIALLHLATSVLIGFLLAFKKFTQQKYLGLLGLLIAIGFHFLYNLALAKAETPLNNLALGILVILGAINTGLFFYSKKMLAQD
ncbi:MAG: PrsW family glutamic-type intramembrane protease [Candidatus Moraniibacteriota bacterium]